MKKLLHQLQPHNLEMLRHQMHLNFLPRKWLKFKHKLKPKSQLNKEDKQLKLLPKLNKQRQPQLRLLLKYPQIKLLQLLKHKLLESTHKL